MSKLLEKIKGFGVVPVVKIDDFDSYVTLGNILQKSGLRIAEITFRTECAADVIDAMKNDFPNLIIGAGTVLCKEDFMKAAKSRSDFIVTPGYDLEVIELAQKHSIPIIPGCSNATDLTQASKHGLNTVKFFPSEALGGLKVIQALSGPFPNFKFMPTGGINSKNIKDYLRNSKILVCGGTWFIDSKRLKENDEVFLMQSVCAAIESILGLKSNITCEGDLWQTIIGQKKITKNLICECEDINRLKFYLNELSIKYRVSNMIIEINHFDYIISINGGKSNE